MGAMLKGLSVKPVPSPDFKKPETRTLPAADWVDQIFHVSSYRLLFPSSLPYGIELVVTHRLLSFETRPRCDDFIALLFEYMLDVGERRLFGIDYKHFGLVVHSVGS